MLRTTISMAPYFGFVPSVNTLVTCISWPIPTESTLYTPKHFPTILRRVPVCFRDTSMMGRCHGPAHAHVFRLELRATQQVYTRQYPSRLQEQPLMDSWANTI